MRLMAVHAAQRVRADIQVGFLEGSLLIPVALTAQLRQRLCVKGGLAEKWGLWQLSQSCWGGRMHLPSAISR